MKIYQSMVYGNMEDGCPEDNWDVTVYVGFELDVAVERITHYIKSIEIPLEADGSEIFVWEDGKLIGLLMGDGMERDWLN